MVTDLIGFSLSNMQIFKLHYLKNILYFLVALTLTEYDSKYLDTNNIHLYHTYIVHFQKSLSKAIF